MSLSDRTTMTFSACTDEEADRLHLASLDILERTGVSVQEPEARGLLLDAGAWAGEGDRVRIPAWMVRQALATAPEVVALHTRDGRRTMPLGGRNVFFGTGSDTPNTIDPHTRERRPAVREDVRRIAALCDALPQIDFIMSMGIPSDVPTTVTYVHEFDRMVQGSRKPVVFTANDNRDMETIWEIATVVAGDAQAVRERPFLLLYSEPLSPLQHTRIGTEKLLFCAERGIPCVYVCGIMAGSNGPVTLAGSVALGNAECLSGLVISQLKSPGAPFVYGGNVPTLDMRVGQIAYASPEFSLTNSLYAALARRYRLPVWGLAGAGDAKTVDAQAGAEAMMSILAALLSGGNLVHDVGYLESGLTSSMEMILLGDELIAMCRRYVRGAALDENAFAADLIDQLGPGGLFLDTAHTRENFRTAHWIPRCLDRRRWDDWHADGSPTLYDRLNAEVRSILASHEPEPLPEDKQKEIARIIRAREAQDAGT